MEQCVVKTSTEFRFCPENPVAFIQSFSRNDENHDLDFRFFSPAASHKKFPFSNCYFAEIFEEISLTLASFWKNDPSGNVRCALTLMAIVFGAINLKVTSVLLFYKWNTSSLRQLNKKLYILKPCILNSFFSHSLAITLLFFSKSLVKIKLARQMESQHQSIFSSNRLWKMPLAAQVAKCQPQACIERPLEERLCNISMLPQSCLTQGKETATSQVTCNKSSWRYFQILTSPEPDTRALREPRFSSQESCLLTAVGKWKRETDAVSVSFSFSI